MSTTIPRILFHAVSALGLAVAVLGYAAGTEWIIYLGSPIGMRFSTAIALAMLGGACAGLLPCPLPKVHRYTISATLSVCTLVMLTGLALRRVLLGDIDAFDIGGMPSLGTMISCGLVACACLFRTMVVGCSARWFGAVVVALCAVALLGHAFGIPALYWAGAVGIGMAPHTAAALAALGVGLAFAHQAGDV